MLGVSKRYIKVATRNYIYQFLLFLYGHKFKQFNGKFEFSSFKEDVLKYLVLTNGKKCYEYRFSLSQDHPDLYSSVYALMLLGLLGETDKLNENDRNAWSSYLLEHQDEDGLFRDQNLNSPLSESCHYFGWNHLAPHVIIALDYLSVRPKYDFQSIISIFEHQSMHNWLQSRLWDENYLEVSNEIMNVGVLLQYSRDYFDNKQSGKLVEEMKDWLLTNKRDPATGLWGSHTNKTKFDISKAIKTSYHILPIFYYDNEENRLDKDSIVEYALKTQNRVGGYSPSVVADACEDIDSLYQLIVLDGSGNEAIYSSLKKFQNWVFRNQNKDGSFVFKRFRPFQYADQDKLSSAINQGNLFGTWFRTLSIAFASDALKLPHGFVFSRVPGYQYKRV